MCHTRGQEPRPHKEFTTACNIHLISNTSTAKTKATELNPRCDPAKFRKVDWDRNCALVLRGPAETSKTSWAIHQFAHPFKIEDLDELKDLPVDCYGIIFDELIFDKCCKKTMVCLLDMKYERTIRTRNTNSRIPAVEVAPDQAHTHFQRDLRNHLSILFLQTFLLETRC